MTGWSTAQAVAEVQAAYGIGPDALAATSTVSPAGMFTLVEALEVHALHLRALDDKRREVADPLAAAVLPTDEITEALDRWDERLAWYRAVIMTDGAGRWDDPGAVLWTVAAPLLAGHYYGADGSEGARPESGWGAVLPPVDGATPDVRTAFTLERDLTRKDVDLPTLLDAIEEALADQAEGTAALGADALLRAIEGAMGAAVRFPVAAAAATAVLVGWLLWR